jgi:abortive infection bacteriophage resistance protein
VKYEKGPTTFDQQIDQLLARGMTGDRDLMRRVLETTNYYRLSGYWYPFRIPILNDPNGRRTDQFRPNTTFDEIYRRYCFDRRLRLLVMDAIERIEVAVRTRFAFHHAHDHGAFGYVTEAASLPKLLADLEERARFLERVDEEIRRSSDTFVTHFHERYGDSHRNGIFREDRRGQRREGVWLPVWMVTEVMTFARVLTMYKSATNRVKNAVAAIFSVSQHVFSSWLLTINSIRNICAHHSRLWNREIGARPIIPDEQHHPEWHRPVPITQTSTFAALTVISWCVFKVTGNDDWARAFRALLREFPNVPTRSMGFPDNWANSPLWAGAD